MKRFKMDLNEGAFKEFGVIAGSNKRRTTWYDVKMLLPSMNKMEFLEDKPITFIWSDDPRLEGYKTKAFKDIVFKFYNGSTTTDANNIEDIDELDDFFDCLGDGADSAEAVPL